MEKPELDVLRVHMEKGEHEAVAVLHQYKGGRATIYAIEWHGPHPLKDDDNSYADFSAAVAAANKLWLSKLQG